MQFDLESIQVALRKFATDRDWNRFHTPKNLSTAIMVEAAELAEIFQWDSGAESSNPGSIDRDRATDEIADVLIYLIRIADVLDIELYPAVLRKLEKNEQKHPVYQERLL
jgi:dCTP diphosphatase